MPSIMVNSVGVVTSVGGHPPEFFAQRIVARLIAISEEAPEPIRQQAVAFRDQMLAIVLAGVRQAVESDRVNRGGADAVHR